jgi:hypothetical protein
MAEVKTLRWHAKVGRVLLAAMVMHLSILPMGFPPAYAQDVTVELDQVTAAIKGQDVTIYARTSAEVDEAKLYIRNLLDLGDFNDLAMEKSGATTFKYTLPLSQQQGELQRLEYYVEVYRGGQPVAKTESYVISFIDPPFVGEVTALPTEGLEKEDWKLFIKGRISRPFYKKWWLWALLGAAGVGATAVLVGGGTTIAGPATVTLSKPAGEIETDPNLNQVCQGAVPLDLSITGGEAPYEAIFTVNVQGGNANVEVAGAGTLQENVDIVVAPESVTPPIASTPGTFRVVFPAVALHPRGTASTGLSSLVYSAIVRDTRSTTSFAGATPGQPLPSNIAQVIDEHSDDRVLNEFAFLTVISNCQQR